MLKSNHEIKVLGAVTAPPCTSLPSPLYTAFSTSVS